MEGETLACDVDRSRPYLRHSHATYAHKNDALDWGLRSSARREQRELHSLRYSDDPHPATTPTTLASIPEACGFIAADRTRQCSCRIGHPARAGLPGSDNELHPRCSTAHSIPYGGSHSSMPHYAICDRGQDEFELKPNIPYFDGEFCIEDYLNWEQEVDSFFNSTNIPQERQVRYVVRKLTGRAGAWWMHLTQTRRHEGRRDVKTWSKLKRLLRQQFLSSYYENQPSTVDSKDTWKCGFSRSLPWSKSNSMTLTNDLIRHGNATPRNLIKSNNYMRHYFEKKNIAIEFPDGCIDENKDMVDNLTSRENGFERLQGYIISEKSVKLSEQDNYKEADQQSSISILEAPFEEEEISTDRCEITSADLYDSKTLPLLLMPDSSILEQEHNGVAAVGNDFGKVDSSPPVVNANLEVELVRDYYDSGGHVNFGLPSANSLTRLSRSLIEFKKEIATANQRESVRGAIRWDTNYLLKVVHRQSNLVELFETLVKMAPSEDEELKLRDYNGDVSKLGSTERFLKGVLGIPFAFKRVDVMLYKVNFEAEIKYPRTSYETLETACEDKKNIAGCFLSSLKLFSELETA